MIGTLDERTLYKELKLSSLGPLAEAYWRMTREVHPSQFGEQFDKESGIVQIFYPGPIVKYQRNNGHFDTKIYHNRGDIKQAEQLLNYLIEYSK